MRSFPRLAWILVLLVLPLAVACGGDDDDSDDDTDSGGPSSQGPGSSSQSNSGSNSSGKFEVKLPDIKEANYGNAKVSIEISGDKKLKIEVEGNGIAVPGFALLTYAGDDASVQIGIQSDDDDNPGAVAITHKDVVTGGGWGQDCKVTATQSDGKLTGEFTCDNVEGLEPGSAKTFKLKLKGTFSAGP